MANLTNATMMVVLLMMIIAPAYATYSPSWVSKGLKLGFYMKSCPQAEYVAKDIINKYIQKDKSLAASILRLHFHDCFVRGCDASVLLNSTASNVAEKDSPPNLTLRGYFIIDAIKAAVEKICPHIVSCADILALAARDGVVAIGGPSWDVPMGRRDGRVSKDLDARINLPRPIFNLSTLIANFASKGLNQVDLVALSGGHTIGVTHCSNIANRLYNFTGKGDSDPLLDPKYLKDLKKKCSPTDTTTTVPMDRTKFAFDNDYFVGIKQRRGIFTSDVALLDSKITKAYVDADARPYSPFNGQFVKSMVKMGLIEILTGKKGEIRKNCKFVN